MAVTSHASRSPTLFLDLGPYTTICKLAGCYEGLLGLQETGRVRMTGVFPSGSGHNSPLSAPPPPIMSSNRVEWTGEQG